MIPFNKPPYTGNEDQFVARSMRSARLSGDGEFSKHCQAWFEDELDCKKALLTPSCTQALEMAALLIDIKAGDEVIMPSFTFVSTANAFAMRGAKIIFVDVSPETMNMDASLVEAAITEHTRAIVPVHYAGVGCDMDMIMGLAEQHGLFVIEDAAQGMGAAYKGRPLGTIGHLGAFSFHETKNYTSGGEGGLLIINDDRFVERAEIIREKGTNRSQFFRGMVDKYTWVDIGSSYLPSDLQAAYLWGQLQEVERIKLDRMNTWRFYFDSFMLLAESGRIELPHIPEDCAHNAHMFYLKLRDIEERTAFLAHLKAHDVMAVFHYVPLHTSPAGKMLGRLVGADQFTTQESERLARLPLWFGMSEGERMQVVDAVKTFFA